MGFVRQRLGWLVLGFVIILGGIWELTPVLINHIYRADGYAFLHQALEILGDEISEPDFCVEGGVTDPQALNLLAQAVGALEQAREARPTDAQTLILLGRAYCLIGRLEEAVAAYEGYAVLRPGSPLGWLEGGFAYEENGKTLFAVEMWIQRGWTDKEFIDAAKQAQNEKKKALALQWLKIAEAFAPLDVQSWYEIGLEYESLGGSKEALEVYLWVLDSNLRGPGLSSIYYQVGKLYQSEGIQHASTQALSFFQTGIEKDDFLSSWEKADSHYRVGTLMRQQGTPADILAEEFQKAIATYPQHAFAHILLGVTYYELYADVSVAEKEILLGLQYNPTNQWGYFHLGEIHRQAEDIDNAIEWYIKALEINPDFEQAQQRLKALTEPSHE